MTHILWQMTTHLVCTEGHIIHAQWTLPDAEVQVADVSSGVKMTVVAPCCQITYEGALLANGCLICLACGADVPSATIESLTKAECPEHGDIPSPKGV